MSLSTQPLTDHPTPDSVVAWQPDGPVSRDRFLADVSHLAGLLPAGGHILNICQNRYHFLVGLGAAIVSGRVSLLPSTLTPEAIARLRSETPDLFCLHDGHPDTIDLPGLAFPTPLPLAGRNLPVPKIPVDQVVAHVYTSGSTGIPLTHRKTWGALVINALSEAERLGARGHALVGTVPPQHMYGFESTVLISPRRRGSLVGTPLLPGRHHRRAGRSAAAPRPRHHPLPPAHAARRGG